MLHKDAQDWYDDADQVLDLHLIKVHVSIPFYRFNKT